MVTTFARTWQRPPTTEEVKGLIDQYVREEILSREAIKLGLEQNDTVIRRRLQQKMEFIAEDLRCRRADRRGPRRLFGETPGPLRKNNASVSARLSEPGKTGEQLEVDAATLLADLRQRGADADLSTLGDSFLLPREFNNEPQRDVASQFGREFAVELAKLKPGEWSGPIQSGYGAHLVFITRRSEGRLPALMKFASR